MPEPLTTDASMYHLSQGAQQLPRSLMRQLIRLTASPEIISFAAGLPAGEALPLDDLRDCIDTVLKRDGPPALQYGPPYAPLRAWLAGSMRERGIDCSIDNIFITNGAQQGLALLAQLFLDSGDGAVIEAITFTGIRQAVQSRAAVIRTVPTDLHDGVDLGALEATLQSEPRPRLATVITDFHNPLGVSLSLEKRRRLAGLAERYEFLLVEDDPYSPLRFEGDSLPPIKAFDAAQRVVYVGSFSKMLAPGLRLGWLVAPARLLAKITVLRETMDLESPALLQRAVAEYLKRGLLEPHLAQLNDLNRERRDVMIGALQKQLGGLAQWTVPQGGIFLWLTLPETVDTLAMFDEALAAQVAYIPGAAFAVAGGRQHTLRLNFSHLLPRQIEAGIKRLADVVKRQI